MSRKSKNADIEFSQRREGHESLPAVSTGHSLVVTSSFVATDAERAAMDKYIRPETRETIDRFRSLMRRGPQVSAPPPATLVPYPTLAADTDIVNKLPRGVISVYQQGYDTGKAEVDEITRQRNQYLQERNTAVQQLDLLNQRVVALECAIKDLSLLQDGPPPPRADPSHGAAGAAGAPGSLDAF